jgi:hypothetical protein
MKSPLLINGFPIALIIACAFDAIPEGIKCTEAADSMAANGFPRKKPEKKGNWYAKVRDRARDRRSGKFIAGAAPGNLTEILRCLERIGPADSMDPELRHGRSPTNSTHQWSVSTKGGSELYFSASAKSRLPSFL